MVIALVIAVAVLAGGVSVGALGSAAASPSGPCYAPLLEGLTFKLARVLAARAGCKLRVKGNPLVLGRVQTIARQSPAAGGVDATVTVWLNRACHKGALESPEIHEPDVTRGPTKLVSGFYVVGGKPRHYFSARKCPRQPEPPPDAGTAEVIDASGAVVATQTSAAGQFVEIPLPAGSYSVRGTFLDTTTNGAHPTMTESVVIPAGHTVRDDFVLGVP
jgi:hypothetical protein